MLWRLRDAPGQKTLAAFQPQPLCRSMAEPHRAQSLSDAGTQPAGSVANKDVMMGLSAAPVAGSPSPRLSVPDLSAAFPSRITVPANQGEAQCVSGLDFPGENARAQSFLDLSTSPSGAPNHELVATTPCSSRLNTAASVSQEPRAALGQSNLWEAKCGGEPHTSDPALVARSDDLRRVEPPTGLTGNDDVPHDHAGQCIDQDRRSPHSASLLSPGLLMERTAVLPTEHPKALPPTGLEARTDGPGRGVAVSSNSAASGFAELDATTPSGPALKVLFNSCLKSSD